MSLRVPSSSGFTRRTATGDGGGVSSVSCLVSPKPVTFLSSSTRSPSFSVGFLQFFSQISPSPPDLTFLFFSGSISQNGYLLPLLFSFFCWVFISPILFAALGFSFSLSMLSQNLLFFLLFQISPRHPLAPLAATVFCPIYMS